MNGIPPRPHQVPVMGAPAPPLDRTNESSLTDSTHSSSSSAERYSLDELDKRPVLVYNYRGTLETSSQHDLCTRLDKSALFIPLLDEADYDANKLLDGQLRVTRKKIPRAASYVDVRRHDLYLPEEKVQYADFPNYQSSLAGIKVPTFAYWSRIFFGNYDELYIVSPETSPASSLADSMESRRVSPTSTWEADGHYQS